MACLSFFDNIYLIQFHSSFLWNEGYTCQIQKTLCFLGEILVQIPSKKFQVSPLVISKVQETDKNRPYHQN